MLLLDCTYTALVIPIAVAFGSRRMDSAWFVIDFVAGERQR